jgi:hypothetical protein
LPWLTPDKSVMMVELIKKLNYFVPQKSVESVGKVKFADLVSLNVYFSKLVVGYPAKVIKF